jgi:hypothetical protein
MLAMECRHIDPQATCRLASVASAALQGPCDPNAFDLLETGVRRERAVGAGLGWRDHPVDRELDREVARLDSVFHGEPFDESYLIVPAEDRTTRDCADLAGKVFAYVEPAHLPPTLFII